MTRKPKDATTSTTKKAKASPRRARKPRKPKVSFDDPAPAAAAAPVDWVYRTGEAPTASPSTEPARAQASSRRPSKARAAAAALPPPPGQTPVSPTSRGWLATGADAVLLPVSLALLTVLAPLGWVSRRRASSSADDSQA